MPRRPSFYILSLLLLLLIGLVYYLTKAVNSPELQKAVEKARMEKAKSQTNGGAIPLPPSAVTAAPSGGSAVDPDHQRLADELNSPQSTPERDLEIVREFLTIYNKAYRGGNPVGLNEDITAALTGTANPAQPGRLFPANSPAIRNGQMVDRWGTPLWFHPESGTKMEIRSAGPDKNLFTPDDVILAQ
jgi:hypothetical protein